MPSKVVLPSRHQLRKGPPETGVPALSRLLDSPEVRPVLARRLTVPHSVTHTQNGVLGHRNVWASGPYISATVRVFTCCTKEVDMATQLESRPETGYENFEYGEPQRRQNWGGNQQTRSENGNAEQLARFLGWFSIGLGITEIIA